MKKSTIALIITGMVYTLPASAQLIDMMSNLAIQGQLSAQGAGQTQTALNMVQQNNIMNNLNLLITELKINHNYQIVNHYNLSPVEWKAGPDNSHRFFVELKNVNGSLCRRIINNYSYQVAQKSINGSNTGFCSQENNVIKLIFD